MASETHNTAGADAANHAAEAGSAGLPQLDFSTYSNQIFWLVISLVVIYFLLARIAIPRIAAILSDRQGAITSDLAAAEDLKARAEQAEEAYQKALADARTEANDIVAAAKADIKAELDKATEEADAKIAKKASESQARIAEIQASAMKSVEDVSKDVTKELVAAMGAKADAKTINAAIAARLKG